MNEKFDEENETSILFKGNKITIDQKNNDNNNEATKESISHTRIYDDGNWGFLLLSVGILTTIGSAIPVGYNIGVINAPSSHIKNWCNETIKERFDIYISDSAMDILWSSVVSIFLIGGAVGSLGGAWVANKFGRKGSFLITGILFVIGGLLFQFCRLAGSIEMLMLGRLIVGLASGLCTTSLPMYLTELCPVQLRGILGTFCAIGVTGGVVVGQVCSLRHVFGTQELWHYGLSAYLVLIAICYLPSYAFPESPKFLFCIRNDREAARDALKRLRGKNSQMVEIELIEMENSTKSESKNCSSFISVIKNPKLLMPLIIVGAFMGGQQLSGINAIFYYSISIFKAAKLSQETAEWANLGAGCINLLVSFAGPFLMAQFNRRPLMLFSCGIDAVILFATAFIIHYIDNASWLPNLCISMIFLYIIVFQFGLGPIPYFIGSEIFETEPRPVGMAVGSLSSWVCNFIIGMFFPIVQRILGAFVFIPFSIACVCLFLLTKLYLPETRNRDISDIAPLISKGFRSRLL